MYFFWHFVTHAVKWSISLIMTLNIQLFTCLLLFFHLKQSYQLKVNVVNRLIEWSFNTFGVLNRDKSPQFYWHQPLSATLHQWQACLFIDNAFSGEKPWIQFFRRQIMLWITSLLLSTSEAPLQRPLLLNDHFMDLKWSVQS